MDWSTWDSDGYAIGGLSVGERRRSAPASSATSPRGCLPIAPVPDGDGHARGHHRAVGAGIDMFDCVLPTRNARNGWAVHARRRRQIRNARYRDDTAPLDERCTCYTCRQFHAALPLSPAEGGMGVILGARLNDAHNLHYYQQLMRELRRDRAGKLSPWPRKSWLEERRRLFYNFAFPSEFRSDHFPRLCPVRRRRRPGIHRAAIILMFVLAVLPHDSPQMKRSKERGRWSRALRRGRSDRAGGVLGRITRISDATSAWRSRRTPNQRPESGRPDAAPQGTLKSIQ